MRIIIRFIIMNTQGLRIPTQSRSQQTLERILNSSRELIAEQSYDEVTIAQIAKRAAISVGGFYSRFENKEALFSALQENLATETQSRIVDAQAMDWSSKNLLDLLHYIVSGNADLYEKYRGVLTVVHLRTRIMQVESPTDQSDQARLSYNNKIISQLEDLILIKREQIRHKQPKVAIRTVIACMTSMLRDAIVFQDRSLYPGTKNKQAVIRQVSMVMYHYLTAGNPS